MANVHRQVQIGFLVIPAGLVVQLLTMLLIASHLGPSRFGVYAVIMGMVNIVIFVISMGLGTILTKFVAEGKQSPSYYVAISLPLACGFAAACSVVLIVIACAAYSIETAGWGAVLAGINILSFGPSMVFSATLRGLQKMEHWMIWFLGHKVVGLAMVLAVLRPLDGGLTTALSVWMVANFVMMFYAAIALWGDAWRGQVRWRLAEVRALLGGSVVVALTAAVARLAMELEYFILAILMPDHVVGVYAAGKRVVNPVGQVLNGAVSIPTFPGLCRLAGGDRGEFSRWSTQLCLIQWIAGLALALAAWAFAPLLIPLVLKKADYGDSIRVVQITIWCLAPALLANQLRYIYIALSREARFLWLSVIYLVLKAFILMVLTLQYGIWGACYGAVLSDLVLAVIVRIGVAATGVSLRLGWRSTGPTLFTAAWMTLLWQLGDRQGVVLTLAVAYFVVGVFVVNRLLRSVRRHIPERAESDGSAPSAAPGS